MAGAADAPDGFAFDISQNDLLLKDAHTTFPGLAEMQTKLKVAFPKAVVSAGGALNHTQRDLQDLAMSPRTRPYVDAILARYPHITSFKGYQGPAINAILNRKSVLLVAATGSGKSLTYAIPVQAMYDEAVAANASAQEANAKAARFGIRGRSPIRPLPICLFLTPTVTIGQNQAASLAKRGHKADHWWGGLTESERKQIETNVADGTTVFLICCPESYSQDDSRRFNTMLDNLIGDKRLCYYVTDEAHLAITWMVNFRFESYNRMLERLITANIPSIGLTATLAVQDVPEVASKIFQKDATLEVLYAGCDRKDVAIHVLKVSNREEKFKLVEEYIANCLSKELERTGRDRPRAGILLLSSTKKQCHDLQLHAEKVHKRHIYVDHSSIDPKASQAILDNFSKNKINVVVATSRYMYGIDKPNIELLIFLDPPSSISDTIQGVGRTNRRLRFGLGFAYLLLDMKALLNTRIAIAYSRKNAQGVAPPEWLTESQLFQQLEMLAVLLNNVTCFRVLLAKGMGQVLPFPVHPDAPLPTAEDTCICGNCVRRRERNWFVVNVDVTAEAVSLLQFIMAIAADADLKKPTVTITFEDIVDGWRGQNPFEGLSEDRFARVIGYSTGSHHTPLWASRILAQLLVHGVATYNIHFEPGVTQDEPLKAHAKISFDELLAAEFLLEAPVEGRAPVTSYQVYLHQWGRQLDSPRPVASASSSEMHD